MFLPLGSHEGTKARRGNYESRMGRGACPLWESAQSNQLDQESNPYGAFAGQSGQKEIPEGKSATDISAKTEHPFAASIGQEKPMPLSNVVNDVFFQASESSSVRSDIFVEKTPPNGTSPVGAAYFLFRDMPLLRSFNHFVHRFYKDVAPDGAKKGFVSMKHFTAYQIHFSFVPSCLRVSYDNAR